MTYTEILEIAANWSAILTAFIATLAYGRFIHGQHNRQLALESYLKEQKLMRQDEGRRSVIHLMAHLAMTEPEVLAAAFRSKKIATAPGIDSDGNANRLLFEYCGTDLPKQRRF